MKKLLLFFFIAVVPLFAQWQLRKNGLPAGTHIGASIDAIDQNNAVAGLTVGIYKTTDAGLNWIKISSDTVVQVSMADAGTIYAVTNKKIIKTADGGTTWNVLYQIPTGGVVFNYIKAFQNGIIAEADSAGASSQPLILKSTDAGANWTQVSNTLTGCWSGDVWHRIEFVTPDIGFFHCSGISPQRTFKTTDGGATWSDVGLNNIQFEMKFYNASYGITVNTQVNGSDTEFFINRTIDGGATWLTKSTAIQTYYTRDIEFIPGNPSELFLTATDGLYYSADSGKVWTKQNLDFTMASQGDRGEDIVFVDSNCGWILSFNGNVYWTDNKGNPVVSNSRNEALPKVYTLEQNYPNPFNPSTVIKYTVAPLNNNGSPVQRVVLKVYDMLGRELATLVNGDKYPGVYSVKFNAAGLATGTYLYKLTAGSFSEVRKMILMK